MRINLSHLQSNCHWTTKLNLNFQRVQVVKMGQKRAANSKSVYKAVHTFLFDQKDSFFQFFQSNQINAGI